MANYRTIWLSDIHLGTAYSRTDLLLDFLKHNEAETIFLVGDIIDLWQLRRRIYWPTDHNLVIQKLLRKARHGTKIVYVPGNHDEYLRAYVPVTLGGIELVMEADHVTADGKRLLITHGDAFDGITRYAKWLAVLGDMGYTVLLHLNQMFNWCRRHLGLGYWSLSAYIKHRVKQAASFITNFEEALAHECKRRNFDGVVCGHIHHAEIRDIGGVLYCNDGDWVESCTALVEHADGKLEIIKWSI
jgi:UDP-2,3-diacylglucosamine pyrophosphatase LpxH